MRCRTLRRNGAAWVLAALVAAGPAMAAGAAPAAPAADRWQRLTTVLEVMWGRLSAQRGARLGEGAWIRAEWNDAAPGALAKLGPSVDPHGDGSDDGDGGDGGTGNGGEGSGGD